MVAVTVTTQIGPGAFLGRGETGPIAAADLTDGVTGEGAGNATPEESALVLAYARREWPLAERIAGGNLP